MNKLGVTYLLGKLYNAIFFWVYPRKKSIAANIHLINSDAEDRTLESVLFYFPDIKYMHFGDHLFFEPLCRLFKVNGVDVYVAPIPSMVEYFSSHKYKIADPDNHGYSYIITKPDFLPTIRHKKNIISIETAYDGIDKPLVEYLIDKLSSFFKLTATISSKPLYFERKNISNYLKLDENTKYIIFNNYIYSGLYRVPKAKFKRLEIFLLQFIRDNPEYKIIHTGSNKDREKDKANYPFVNIDLRGKTDIYDLFDLCKLPNVCYYIGFDGFVMHLFFLQGKKAYVMSRGRWSAKARHFLENYIDPPFTPTASIQDLKVYIR